VYFQRGDIEPRTSDYAFGCVIDSGGFDNHARAICLAALKAVE